MEDMLKLGLRALIKTLEERELTKENCENDGYLWIKGKCYDGEVYGVPIEIESQQEPKPEAEAKAKAEAEAKAEAKADPEAERKTLTDNELHKIISELVLKIDDEKQKLAYYRDEYKSRNSDTTPSDEKASHEH